MIKRVDNALYRQIADTFSGQPKAGIVEFGLAQDGVGFSLDEHNRSLLSEEMLARVAAIRDSIIEGAIPVPHETGRS
jgi:basic membrane protein A